MTPDPSRIADSYYTTQLSGEKVLVAYVLICPQLDERYVPILELNETLAKFFKWKFKEPVEQQVRWGKDWLRKEGYVVTARGRDEYGKYVKLYEKPPK